MYLTKFILFVILLTVRAQQLDYDYEYRLPKSLTPLIYDLKLTLSSYSDEVQGRVNIQIQCENETNFVELHANPLFIVNTSLENRLLGKTEFLDWPISDSNRQTIRFDLTYALKEKHVYYLNIEFTTKYSFDDRGLVRSQDPIRETWFNTLFEPSHARRLFPAFDEPHWRSSFKLELHMEGEYADEKMVALSSMDTEKVIRKDNLTIWHFIATPPIPTYIFTVAAGRFRSVCNSTFLSGKEICIWRFAYWRNWESMAHILISSIARYHGQMCDYLLSDPVARLHFLIVPSNLKGMESFGLLNLRESLWPARSDKRSMQMFAQTLYHEMIHQWFGNLVTIKWWNDIWLAESLTNFLASFKPLEIDLQHDKYTDPLVSNKWAMGIPSIAYTKGAIIMEMLNSLIGAKRMRRLLRLYLHVHQFGYASTDTFLDLLQKVTKDQYVDSDKLDSNTSMITAVEFVHYWLHQPGHPIVFINYDKQVRQFVLSQTPKLVDNNQTLKVEWPIPVWTSCALHSKDEQLHWLRPFESLSLKLNDLTSSNDTNAVIFNANQAVYYKLSYRY